MKTWRPSRPSPAMIVALLALCVALGGSAIAATSSGTEPSANAAKKKKKVKLAPKNSVNSAAVINNSLKLSDFKSSERSKLKGDTGAQGPAGTPDGYTRTEADGKFLGKSDKAADADKLDGKDSTEVIQAGGAGFSAVRVFSNNTSSNNFVSLPGIGHVEFSCGAAMSLTFANDSADDIQWEQSEVGGA